MNVAIAGWDWADLVKGLAGVLLAWAATRVEQIRYRKKSDNGH